MTGIPQSGYGTWRQWHRRAKKNPSKVAFFVNDAVTQREVNAWAESFNFPFHLSSMREAAEAQT